jgi:hypothetical protein
MIILKVLLFAVCVGTPCDWIVYGDEIISEIEELSIMYDERSHLQSVMQVHAHNEFFLIWLSNWRTGSIS